VKRVVESLIADGSVLVLSQSAEVGHMPYREWLRDKGLRTEFPLKAYIASPDLKVAQEFELTCRNMPPGFVDYLREESKKKQIPHGQLIAEYADFLRRRDFAVTYLTSCSLKNAEAVRRFDLGIDLGSDHIAARETTFKDGGIAHVFVLPGGIITFFNNN
jgi:hypothetical protein